MANKNQIEGDIVREFFDYVMKKYPQPEPVILILRKNLINYGYYSFNGDKHYIFLRSSETEGEIINSAIHELSHLFQFQQLMKDGKDDEEEHHSDLWGKKFALVYRTYLEFIDLKEKEGKI